MNNFGSITKKFLTLTDVATKHAIMSQIASHYNITLQEAEAEVTDDEAESLLDYLQGPMRAATNVLLQKHKLRV